MVAMSAHTPDEQSRRRAHERAGRRPRRSTATQRRRHARRRLTLFAVLAVLVATGAYVAAGSGRSSGHPARAAHGRTNAVNTTRPAAVRVMAPPPLQVSAPRSAPSNWTVVALVHGQPAAWVAQHGGVTLLRLDQSLVHLTLHAGSVDGGEVGWRFGDKITAAEIHHVLAAFNGGFKLSYPGVGFTSGSHVASPLQAGLGSIVTYTDGTTNIGSWDAGVPGTQKHVFSVLQNQGLLVDRGVAPASTSNCITSCWGATIGARTSVARSGIGITQSGQLVWAAGEQLVPSELASALIGAGVLRAVELDINPDWVAGYLFEHHRGGPTGVPLVPGQLGIAGMFLQPYSRDFLAVVAN
jgi:hypothetical protein